MTFPSVPALTLLGWMALSGAIHAVSAQAPPDDATAIRALITKTWDKPEARLVADPIVVDGNYAIAGWTQGGRGGRALLHKDGDAWRVMLCSGDPLQSASVLIDAGVPAATAGQLADELRAAERAIDPARLALFSTFEGVMRMDAADEHHKPR